MKPIIFNTEMVQAILEGRKTVTRRVIKCNLYDSTKETAGDFELCDRKNQLFFKNKEHFKKWALRKCRYKVGDILWVRETWFRNEECLLYKASKYENTKAYHCRNGWVQIKWRPSIHMPKEAARIFLKVTDVRVERLQEITSEQAKNEGVDLNSGTPFPKAIARDCHGAKNGLSMYQSKFVILWNSTIKKKDLDRYGWSANPWVRVIEFERVEVEE